MDKKSSGDTADWLLSALLAGAGFLASFLVLDFGLAPALAISGGCGAAGLFLFRRRHPPAAAETVDSGDLAAALAEGKGKLDQIRALQRQFPPGAVAAKVDSIARTTGKILAEVKRDPPDLKRARQFLSYYLDATIIILEKYIKLTAQNVGDASVRAALARVDGMLDTIDHAYEKQLARLLSNDVLDLDTELALLEKTITMEGLGEEPQSGGER